VIYYNKEDESIFFIAMNLSEVLGTKIHGGNMQPFHLLSKKLKTFRANYLAALSVPLVFGWGLSALSLFLFVKLSEELLENELVQFDSTITSFVRLPMSERLTGIMTSFSLMGSAPILLLLALIISIVLVTKKNFWEMIQLGIVLTGSVILNQLLKLLFQRQRPSLEHLVSVTGLSFPSGHAMVSYSFYGLIIYIVITTIKPKWIRGSLVAFLSLLILFIGISRIYLGVHYPSDVFAGFAAGSFWLASCIFVLKKLKDRRYARSAKP